MPEMKFFVSFPFIFWFSFLVSWIIIGKKKGQANKSTDSTLQVTGKANWIYFSISFVFCRFRFHCVFLFYFFFWGGTGWMDKFTSYMHLTFFFGVKFVSLIYILYLQPLADSCCFTWFGTLWPGVLSLGGQKYCDCAKKRNVVPDHFTWHNSQCFFWPDNWSIYL